MELLNGIKNIIFDFGGVIINLDFKLTLNQLKLLGLNDSEKRSREFSQLSWFSMYETGEIDSEAFIAEFSKVLNPGTSPREIKNAWNAMLLDFPRERAELLESLKSRYRTFLLSNTNELHINYYFKYLKDHYGYEGMSRFFEKDYYSHRVGMRKPDRKIFRYVLDQNGLNAAETLFIDDSLQHVEGARSEGLRAYHLQAPETIMDILT